MSDGNLTAERRPPFIEKLDDVRRIHVRESISGPL